jgi:hypothetical protein
MHPTHSLDAVVDSLHPNCQSYLFKFKAAGHNSVVLSLKTEEGGGGLGSGVRLALFRTHGGYGALRGTKYFLALDAARTAPRPPPPHAAGCACGALVAS